MPSVYIETSIPSYYHETRRDARSVAWREATREWWDKHRHRFDLCTSGLTLIELGRAPRMKSRSGLELLEGVRLLEPRPEIGHVTNFYIEQKLMPMDVGGDAGHLAFASVHGIDFLLTWNCEHLANANKVPHVRALNARLGLKVPVLTTPSMLIPEDFGHEQAEEP